MIADSLADYVRRLEAMMLEARQLGLYRTTEHVHTALNTARAEVFEVIVSTPGITVSFAVGPIREQRP